MQCSESTSPVCGLIPCFDAHRVLLPHTVRLTLLQLTFNDHTGIRSPVTVCHLSYQRCVYSKDYAGSVVVEGV